MKITAKHIIWAASIMGIGIVGIFLFYIIALKTALDFPGPEDIPLNKSIAFELTQDFNEYQKIYEMDDATRCYKSLNEQPLSLAKFGGSSDSICNWNGSKLDEVLTKFRIDRAVYLDFRSRLEETKLRHYCRSDNLNIFVVDGWIDDVWGYCYSAEPLEVGEKQYHVCNYTIQIVEDMGDNWYLFGGK